MFDYFTKKCDEYRAFVGTEAGKRFSRMKNILAAMTIALLAAVSPLLGAVAAFGIIYLIFLELTVDMPGKGLSSTLWGWLKGNDDDRVLLATVVIYTAFMMLFVVGHAGLSAVLTVLLSAIALATVFMVI